MNNAYQYVVPLQNQNQRWQHWWIVLTSTLSLYRIKTTDDITDEWCLPVPCPATESKQKMTALMKSAYQYILHVQNQKQKIGALIKSTYQHTFLLSVINVSYH